jgi:hypothetical protein
MSYVAICNTRRHTRSRARALFRALATFFALACLIASAGCGSASMPQQGRPPIAGPQLTVEPSLVDFGNVVVGTTNSQTLQLSNTGTALLNVNTIDVSGSGVTISGQSLPLTLGVGKTANFSAEFKATAPASASGTVSIRSDAQGSPLVVKWGATAVPESHKLSASSSSLDFGSVADGTTSSQEITLTSTGNSKVNISKVSTSKAHFSVKGVPDNTVLMPGQSATLIVSFEPKSSGNDTANLSVDSDASDSQVSIALSGVGISANSAATPHSVNLSWARSSSPGIAGYFVYRGTTLGNYSRLTSSPVSGDSYTDSTIQTGHDTTYYYVVTAVNLSGEQSTDSQPAIVTVP